MNADDGASSSPHDKTFNNLSNIRLVTPTFFIASQRAFYPGFDPMSDHYEMLVDVDVSGEDASAMCDLVIREFQARGMITGDLNPDCVLGGEGYLPGPEIPHLYRPGERETTFWSLKTCGVEPAVGYNFNDSGLGESCEYFQCPRCDHRFHSSDARFLDRMAEAFRVWYVEKTIVPLHCDRCGADTPLDEWGAKPPLGFGHLSFRFWNWPPFDDPGWSIDVPGLVYSITGHRIERTYARI